MKKILGLLICVFCFQGYSAEKTVEYGQVFVKEEYHISKYRPQIDVGYAIKGQSELFDIQTVLIGANVFLTNYFYLGLEFDYMFNKDGSTLEEIKKEIPRIYLIEGAFKPQWGSFLRVGVAPIMGKVNFFNAHVMPITAYGELGLGIHKYKNAEANPHGRNINPTLYISGGVNLEIYKGLFTDLSIRRTFDSIDKNEKLKYNQYLVKLGIKI